uniref:Saposin B-type domain-containing protein n=1 Tax=Paramormyrops kingsleyae TaxID=1676925 RepID=A0A3B3R4D1_9TELE
LNSRPISFSCMSAYFKVNNVCHNIFNNMSLLTQPLPASHVCLHCFLLMVKCLINAAQNAPTQPEQIKNLLTDTCNEIGFLRMICKHLLGKFIDVLVEEISTSDNVNTICAAVKASPTHKEEEEDGDTVAGV